jgi:hypothetical protein
MFFVDFASRMASLQSMKPYGRQYAVFLLIIHGNLNVRAKPSGTACQKMPLNIGIYIQKYMPF